MTKITAEYVDGLVAECHGASKKGGWWSDLATSEPLKRNKGEMLALIHTEIGEAYRGRQDDAMDEHLPHRKSEEVELADTVIRICDYIGGWNLEGFTNKVMYVVSKPKPPHWTHLLVWAQAEERTSSKANSIAFNLAYHRFRMYVDDTVEHARKGRAVGQEEALSILFVELHDWAEASGYDLAAAIKDKLDYNAQRADHKVENRAKDGGKEF
jgi:hypothetical protein